MIGALSSRQITTIDDSIASSDAALDGAAARRASRACQPNSKSYRGQDKATHIGPCIAVLGGERAQRRRLLTSGHADNLLDLRLELCSCELAPTLVRQSDLEELVLPDERDVIVRDRVELACRVRGFDRIPTRVESVIDAQQWR